MVESAASYRPETREWAVRVVLSQTSDASARREAIGAVAAKIGCTPRTLRRWVRQADLAGGFKPGMFTDPKQRVRELEREVAALRRANELLRREA